MTKQAKAKAFDPTNQRNPSTHRFNYRSAILKTYGLLSLLALTLILIGILEYAHESLPHGLKAHETETSTSQLPSITKRAPEPTVLQTFVPASVTQTLTVTPCPSGCSQTLSLSASPGISVSISLLTTSLSSTQSPTPTFSTVASNLVHWTNTTAAPLFANTTVAPSFANTTVNPAFQPASTSSTPSWLVIPSKEGNATIPAPSIFASIPRTPTAAAPIITTSTAIGGVLSGLKTILTSSVSIGPSGGTTVVQVIFVLPSSTSVSSVTSRVVFISTVISTESNGGVTFIPITSTAPSAPLSSSSFVTSVDGSPIPPVSTQDSSPSTIAASRFVTIISSSISTDSTGGLTTVPITTVEGLIPSASAVGVVTTFVPSSVSSGGVSGLTAAPTTTLGGLLPSPTSVGPFVTIVSSTISTDSTGGLTIIPITTVASLLPSAAAVGELITFVSSSISTDSTGGLSTVPITAVGTVFPSAAAVGVLITFVSSSVLTDSTGGLTTVPITSVGSLPPSAAAIGGLVTFVSSSVSTDSTGGLFTIPVTTIESLSPSPIAASQFTTGIPSVSTDSTGGLFTFPITSFQNLPPPATAVPGLITFVSSSVETDSTGGLFTVPITMVKAKDESSSLIGDVILMTSFSVWTGTNGDVHTVPVTMLSTRPISATQAATATPTATQPPNSGGLGIPAAVAIFTWPTSKTFLGGYLPILMAKLFQMSWGSLHTHINGLTPFSHLASPQGASAGELSGPGFSTWYVSVAYSAVWIMTPIASETIWFDTNYQCSNPDLNNPSNPCWPPRMSVNSPIVRVLQTLLTLVAVVTLAIIVLWFRKPSGCSGDPTSIAAVAQLMGHPEVVRDFQNLDAEMTEKELEVFLKDKRYKLDMYQTATGAQRYGIVPAPLDGRPTQEVLQIPHDIDSSPRVIRNILAGWKSLATYADAIFVFFLLGLLSIVAAYVKGGANSRLTKLFETDSVGRRLFFAILACVAAAKWGRIQRDTQTFAPYMRLNQPDAPAAPTILLRKHTLPLTSFIPMIKNRHFIPASIAFTALLSEFLVVVLSGLPYRPGQLRSEFLFCGITSLVILSAMFVMLGVFTVWRKALPHLPRKPDSVAKVMTYVCHSRMNDDFEGMEALSMKERDKKIMALKKRYKYSLLIKEDGRRAWVVDEMEQQPLLESKNALEEGREQTEFWRWARAAA